ncbi:MAG: RIO1 family regulatory kinase/ATPase [Nitrososphaeraceae archaeon]|nr:RIO1 family regulatory kinase/ATPase [Nitrososphaeraceae archaeon]
MSDRTFLNKRNRKRFSVVNSKPLIGEGMYGAVFLDKDNNRCIKVGEIAPKEFKYLYQLAKHGIAPKPYKIQSDRTELIMEYINGYTLNDVIDIPDNSVYTDVGAWTKGLFNSLVDTMETMHLKAKLSHEDLHVKNIMYDKVNDRFVIIDAAAIYSNNKESIVSNLLDFKYEFYLPSMLRQYITILIDQLFPGYSYSGEISNRKDFYKKVKEFYRDLRSAGTQMIICP